MRREGKKLAQVARVQARGQLHIERHDPDRTPEDSPDAAWDEAAAAFGLRRVVDAPQASSAGANAKCYLWPCNRHTFDVWQQVQTQWLYDGVGPSGLNYAGVIAYLDDVLGMLAKPRRVLFGQLQVMERAALDVWAAKRH